ncbi:hypothetical protein ACLI4Z_10315 [Natrialbaceae archaeon A-arb3/5]
MPIPGYDSGTVAEYELTRAGARLDVVAGVVPESFGLEPSVVEPPPDVLADPIDLIDLDQIRAIEAIRIELVYDPAALPPGASPTDVVISVDDGDEWHSLESTVDLQETTVTAVVNDRPPGSTVVAAYDEGNGAL